MGMGMDDEIKRRGERECGGGRSTYDFILTFRDATAHYRSNRANQNEVFDEHFRI